MASRRLRLPELVKELRDISDTAAFERAAAAYPPDNRPSADDLRAVIEIVFMLEAAIDGGTFNTYPWQCVREMRNIVHRATTHGDRVARYMREFRQAVREWHLGMFLGDERVSPITAKPIDPTSPLDLEREFVLGHLVGVLPVLDPAFRGGGEKLQRDLRRALDDAKVDDDEQKKGGAHNAGPTCAAADIAVKWRAFGLSGTEKTDTAKRRLAAVEGRSRKRVTPRVTVTKSVTDSGTADADASSTLQDAAHGKQHPERARRRRS